MWFWGTRKLTDGWLAFVAIVVVLALLGLAARKRDGAKITRGASV